MAAIRIHELLFIFTFLSFTSATGVFDRVLDDITTCSDKCSNTYTPHTFEKSYLVDVCKRGCRFFTIMEFIYNHDNLNMTMKGCTSSCEEAYNTTDEETTCIFGCKNQVPQLKKFNFDEDPMDMMNIHFINPFMYVHNMYSNMVDKVWNGLSVRWSFYMRSGDGSVIVVKSEPQFTPEFDSIETDDDYNTAHYLETNLEEVDRSATPVIKRSQIMPREDGTQYAYNVNGENTATNDWLSCVSKKTGLSRVFLSMLLFMSAMMMIWLCLTAMVTAPDQRVHANNQRLSINGDLEHIKQMKALGMEISYPQVISDDAGPLPVKVKVQRL
ncbi:transmembrane protein 59-like [Mytilus galloprovincialis]|uniref:transmembrane protein 59-like n=1 Tax=Mytilus galloprovincialis TaxID=29158 RepID=UPI003F7B365A